MNASDFLRLPPGVKILVLVMLWPAIWAGALTIGAFAGDVIRHSKMRTSPAWRKVARLSEDL
ncbi:MAG TPA: hypothetical protein VLV86_09015 [Vicinamibacterales bacterium]|nr:hypothetical protein [Vicinamibacterales bacterium]